MTTIPLIKLTIDGFRQEVVAALTSQQIKLDTLVQEEMDRVCTKEHSAVIRQELSTQLQKAIQSSIAAYFQSGSSNLKCEKSSRTLS